jgi:hypothetical protein
VTKIRDIDKDTDSFQAIKPGRAKRTGAPKIDKATEARLSTLTDQNERLSRQNLALTNILKRALHWVPDHLKCQYEANREAVASGNFEDVHPI